MHRHESIPRNSPPSAMKSVGPSGAVFHPRPSPPSTLPVLPLSRQVRQAASAMKSVALPVAVFCPRPSTLFRRSLSKPRRVGAVPLALAVLVLSLFSVPAASANEEEASASSAAESTEEDDGFRIESRRIEDYRGTQQDVESNITDDLSAKLRQFDEWTMDSKERAAAETAKRAAEAKAAAEASAAARAAAAASAAAAANAAAAASAAAAQGGGGATGVPGAVGGAQGGGATAGASGAWPQRPAGGRLPVDPNAPIIPQGVDPTREPTRGGWPSSQPMEGGFGTYNPNSTRAGSQSSQRPQPRGRADRRAKEDDVAQMIREAAEQETDPERRQELMDQYEAYIDSL